MIILDPIPCVVVFPKILVTTSMSQEVHNQWKFNSCQKLLDELSFEGGETTRIKAL